MTRLLSLFERLALFLLLIAAVIGAAMSGGVFVAVVMRYVFFSPLRITEELVGLMFSAGIFLSMPLLFARNRNIRVELIFHRLPARARPWVRSLADLLTIVFFLVFGALTYDFAAFSHQIGARSEVAEIPVAPWMMIMPLVSFLTALIVTLRLLAQRRDGTDEADHEAVHI